MSELGKREMERFDLKVPAFVTIKNPTRSQDSEAALEMRTKDICAGGAYLITATPFQTDTKVDIDIRLALFNGSADKVMKSGIHVSGSVIRTDTAGMAVKFNKNFQILPAK